ncbi:hypothetical protein PQJ75_08265 [Rhodoplanes sp. TEM]|uniref:Acetyltransferase n=1 Tax=Rhodoplanes tepidamans TaxID=200616 RepID=A0ABT5JAM7_RHOTP|nr:MULTISPECIES: hypothetical protein [Rhodoplanes]MDC7786714.1 hypothetical protein [Rhodoplanes tepidamans]MDC7983720.1 hypothetical protein [Rhodoplanes sp. TEM]MDQ0358150.1 acetyltransferase-like isoleucine patch superfamily enzyme [Rhodoplanes tepidamans]
MRRGLPGIVAQLLLWPLPWRLRRAVLRRGLGFRIEDGARIGFSVVCAGAVRLGAFSRIGHLTLVRDLARLELGEHAVIGNLNKIAGVPRDAAGAFGDEPDRDPSLVIGRHAAITNSHLIDCTNRVEIGAFATVAGWGTQILTHGIDIAACRQRSAPVTVGPYGFVGTRCVLLKGAVLPERSVLAAGSVLGRAETQSCILYSGVPAGPVKPLDPASLYFSRTVGRVA